ncbi:MAG: DUF2127 domain-containing protein, partial [Steroidobacteraceae bacterium]
RRRDWREVLFLVGICLKGLDGAVELAAGAALLSVSPDFVLHAVRFLTQDEIAEDPHDLVANALRHAAGHVTFATEHFMAIYLLVHGVIKFGLVWALLARVLVAYPLSIVVFTGFIAYQTYRFTFTHSLGLLALSGFDLLVIVLVWLEYRILRRRA